MIIVKYSPRQLSSSYMYRCPSNILREFDTSHGLCAIFEFYWVRLLVDILNVKMCTVCETNFNVGITNKLYVFLCRELLYNYVMWTNKMHNIDHVLQPGACLHKRMENKPHKELKYLCKSFTNLQQNFTHTHTHTHTHKHTHTHTHTTHTHTHTHTHTTHTRTRTRKY